MFIRRRCSAHLIAGTFRSICIISPGPWFILITKKRKENFWLVREKKIEPRDYDAVTHLEKIKPAFFQIPFFFQSLDLALLRWCRACSPLDKVSFSPGDNGRGGWNHSGTQGRYPRIVIYCKRTPILGEICHNTGPARCVPPGCRISSWPTGSPCQTLRRVRFVIVALRPSNVTEKKKRAKGWKGLS